MSIILRIIIDLFLAMGCFFAIAGTVGMIRMPDAYTRMQSSTNIATLGLLGVLMGALLYAIFVMGSASMAIKIALIGAFAMITNPVASHAICRAAYKYGVEPRGLVRDDYMDDHTAAEPSEEPAEEPSEEPVDEPAEEPIDGPAEELIKEEKDHE